MEQQSNATLAIVGIIVAIGLIGGGIYFSTANKASETVTTNSQSVTTTDTPSPSNTTTPAASTYKDGTYTATGNYVSPGGAQSITISLTVTNDVITDASATSGAIDPQSKQWQAKFISGFKTQVVGKSLASLSLSNVSGSSLTPIGFNAAVAAIRAEAQS